MGSGSKSTITGYRYSFSIHMGLSRGPINAFKHVKIGGITAWYGEVTGNTELNLNAPNLFGGDTKEGGIVGTLTVMMGGAAQVVSGAIKALMGGFVPDFLGTATLFYRGQIGSNNPYPKPWAFRIARWDAGWDIDEGDPDRAAPWYANKALVSLNDGAIQAMNPAHILYQCYTDRLFGRGYHPSSLYEPAWIAAANTFCDEGFGLCMLWNRQQDVDEFIQIVLRHVNARVYPHPETGQIAIRLIRADYDPDSLPVFDYNSGILQADDDETGSEDTGFSEIVVKYKDALTGQEASVTENSPGLMQANGEIRSTTASFPGLPTAELALRVARRELDLQLASRRFKLLCDRRAWKLVPGTPFKLSLPDRGISEMIVRVGDYSDQEFTAGGISLVVVEDFFGMPDTRYADIPTGAWTPPDRTPAASTPVFGEANYRDLAATLSPGDLSVLTADVGNIFVRAAQPSPMTLYYDLATAATGETLAVRTQGAWTPGANLTEDIGYYDTLLSFSGAAQLADAQAGEIAQVGDELIGIVDVDTDTAMLTVKRGVADTIPQKHASGTRVWFYDGLYGTDGREYAIGEDVTTRLLSVTSSESMDIDSAPGGVVTIVARQGKPYPPGDVQINGVPFGDFIDGFGVATGEVAVSWTHRDRLLQADQLVEHEAGSVGPEAGTTYAIDIYDGATLLRSTTGISADNWTYDSGMIASDGEPTSGEWVFKLRSVRDGYDSFQKYSIRIIRVLSRTLEVAAPEAIDFTGFAPSLAGSRDLTVAASSVVITGFPPAVIVM